MYNYSKLLGLMREKGETQETLSGKIGINPATFNQKIKNNSQFKQDEMKDIMECLGLTINDITEYFFAK